jgi:hypothetical protein
MKMMLIQGNQIHNFISSFGSGTVIYYVSGSGSDFLTSYGSGSGYTSQKVTVPTVSVPQSCSQGRGGGGGRASPFRGQGGACGGPKHGRRVVLQRDPYCCK